MLLYMVNYCECCDYKTNLTANFKKHLSSKKHISVNLKSTKCQPCDTPKSTSPYTCKYCNQEFKFRQSMYRHIKYSCTKNKDEDLKELVRLLNLKIESQDKQIESQNKKIEKLMGKLEINNSFNTTNVQNNITLLAYKETDLSHLTEADYRSCIKKVNHSVMTLVDKIHFNKSKPENMNFCISNMKDKYLMTYDGKNWNLANKKEELDKLYEEKEMILEEWLDSNPDPVLKERFLKYLNNKEKDDCLNKIKEDLKLMIYNKSNELALGKNAIITQS
jgi:hypothetical protein